MAKIQLTIDKNYCSGWGVWHGVRELLQNAKDAEDYEGRSMEVAHYPRTNRLEITTRNAYVDPSALLVLGKTSKAGGGQRGKFGEGFALGVLALVRHGCDVKFRNGDHSWSVGFESPEPGHPLEGNELLTFRSRELQAKESDFKVEVENISTAAWDIIRNKVLFLSPPKSSETITVSNGMMLLHPDKKGEVYVRGLFVRKFEDLSVGYDIHHVELDRDRQMINEWDLHYALGQMWAKACEIAPELSTKHIYAMAQEGTPEVKNLKYHADDKLLQQMRDRFEGDHGADAIPVTTNHEARDVEQAGGKPQMVSSVMKELLEKTGLSVENAKKRLESVVERRWAPGELLHGEHQVSEAALRCLTKLEAVLPQLVIVTFRGDKPGCHLIDEKTVVALDRRLLETPRQAFQVAVAAEAQRRGISPLDVLLDHVSGERLQSTSGTEAPEF